MKPLRFYVPWGVNDNVVPGTRNTMWQSCGMTVWLRPKGSLRLQGLGVALGSALKTLFCHVPFKVNLKNFHVIYYWIHPQQKWGKMKAKFWWKNITLTSLWCQIFKQRQEKIPLAVSYAGLNQSHAYTPFEFVFSATTLHLHCWNILPLPNQTDITGKMLAKNLCQGLSAAHGFTWPLPVAAVQMNDAGFIGKSVHGDSKRRFLSGCHSAQSIGCSFNSRFLPCL